MSQEIVKRDGEVIESVIAKGDLAKLEPEQRVDYYTAVCRSLGLNPLTQPFAYIQLNNKLTLYAKRDATDQLRAIHGVNISIAAREHVGGVYVVVARATARDGRQDESIGAVNIEGAKGDALANALMKAETKAKRRVTLSIVGLGWLDETEVETVPSSRPRNVDLETGEIIDSPVVSVSSSVEDKKEPEAATEAQPARPYAPEVLIPKFRKHIVDRGEHIPLKKGTDELTNKGARDLLVGKLTEMFAPDDRETITKKVNAFFAAVVDNPDPMHLGKEAAVVFTSWMLGAADDTGDRPIKPHVTQEAAAIVAKQLAHQGQLPGLE